MDIYLSKKKYPWWKNRTGFEKCLVLIVILAIIIITFLGLMLYLKKPLGDKSKGEVCMTEKCVHAAANILDKIDTKVQPCEDFYKFACGNFIKSTTIPEDRIVLSSISTLEDKVMLQLRKIYEEPVDVNDSKSLRLIKTVYSSCMNTTKIETEALGQIKKLFRNLGGWPVVDYNQWNEKGFDWKKLMYTMRRIGLRRNVFFTVYVGNDLRNSSQRIITITQPCTAYESLKRGFNDTTVKAYYEYMVDAVIIFGAERLRAISEMREVVEFEINLAKIFIPWEERKNSSLEHNPMTIRELQKEFPSIPWLQYINVYLSPIEMVTSDENVNVRLPTFLANLENLLLKTSKKVLANYMFWLVVENSIAFLPETIRKRNLEYIKVIYGKIDLSPRWQDCIWDASRLSIASSSVYLKRHFDQSSKRKIAELVSDMRNSFYETLKKIGWMDRKTKKHALLKADKMTSYIGYPDQLLNDQKVEEFYQTLQLNADEFHLDLNLNISLFHHMHYIKTLREPVIKSDWRRNSYSYIVNAYYAWQDNNIGLPAAVLQDPLFDSGRPQYMNYGAIGEIIGHEITHGFDDIGRQFDKDGNLVDWWAPETNKTFARKSQCFVDQYENYSVPEIDMKLNGVKTLGENIADNGGIKIAYRGYQKWLERNAPEPTLPGLPYTSHQLFWISAATSWCTKYKKEYLKTMVQSGFHSPTYFRILVPYMNSDYFARDFNCPLGTPMNPKYKCRVW